MLRHDQAEGLRRLLAPVRPRVIACVGAARGVGRDSAVLNLATALAYRGRAVLVLDGHAPEQGLWGALGVKARTCGAQPIVDAVTRGPAGIALRAGAPGRSAVVPAGGRPAFDVVLLHPAQPWTARPQRADLAGADVLVAMSAKDASATAAYAVIKRFSMDCGISHFRALVNRAESEAQASALVRNVARVARRFLAVSLDLLGWVPTDPKLGQAARLRLPVVEAFPSTPAARAYCAMAERIADWPLADSQSEDVAHPAGRPIKGPRVAAAVR